MGNSHQQNWRQRARMTKELHAKKDELGGKGSFCVDAAQVAKKKPSLSTNKKKEE